MTPASRRLAVVLAAAGIALTGCGSSEPGASAPSSRIEPVAGSSVGKIVLTAVGAQRIGIQTAPAQGVPAPTRPAAPGGHPAPPPRTGGPSAVIPLSAVVYDPSGQTYAFSNPAPLTYVEVPITIDYVSGSSAYLAQGPRPGTPVVTVGAEELFGVQTGVFAQT